MPERTLLVRWPDDKEQAIYSPSSIVDQYFSVGDKLAKEEFVAKSTEALQQASKRVEEKYGYFCSSAMASIEMVKAVASQIAEENGIVEVLAIR